MNSPTRHMVGLLALVLMCLSGCREKLPEDFAGSGVLEATTVTVSSLTTGIILSLSKEEGDQVKKEECLARIDVDKLVLQKAQIQANIMEIDAGRISADAVIAQAEENMENVDTRYNRVKALFNKGSATQQQYDDISTQLNVARNQLVAAKAQKPVLDAKQAQAEATLRLLERRIKDGTVASPLNGVVVEKYVETGEVAVEGGALYKIADLNDFYIKIYVAEPDMDRFRLGETVHVQVDAMDAALSGTVTWASPEAEFTPKNVQTREARAELVYAVKIEIKDPNARLKIGMPAEVYFHDAGKTNG